MRRAALSRKRPGCGPCTAMAEKASFLADFPPLDAYLNLLHRNICCILHARACLPGRLLQFWSKRAGPFGLLQIGIFGAVLSAPASVPRPQGGIWNEYEQSRYHRPGAGPRKSTCASTGRRIVLAAEGEPARNPADHQPRHRALDLAQGLAQPPEKAAQDKDRGKHRPLVQGACSASRPPCRTGTTRLASPVRSSVST